jgi:hypothetical protein
LHELLYQLAAIRRQIAEENQTPKRSHFGLLRTHTTGYDYYSAEPAKQHVSNTNQNIITPFSVIDISLWPTVRKFAKTCFENPENQFVSQGAWTYQNHLSFENFLCTFTTEVPSGYLIKQSLHIGKSQDEINFVLSIFALSQDVDAFKVAIKAVMEDLEAQLNDWEANENADDAQVSKEKFVEILAEFAYNYARLYPFERGTGGIGGIIIRGLLDIWYHHDLKDIAIDGIPYDVLTHFMPDDKDAYIKAFKEAVLPQVKHRNENHKARESI